MPTALTTRQILENLVSFPTVSRDSNLGLIDWVEEYLNSFAVNCHRVYNEDRTKASLYANVGPEVEGGVILSGHTDVVPVDGQAWDTDPFEVVEKDGKLFGRGTCDMKGFDALALAAVAPALERGLKRPIQIALSYDEEVGCVGAPPMIDALKPVLPPAAAAIIGEPTMMKTVTGHKGGPGFRVHVRGFEVHSSLMHKGVNAIMEGAKLIDWANRTNDQIRAKAPTPLAEVFEPPFTTVHCGTIQGGTAHNITALDCHFGMDFRVVPGEDMDAWAQAFLDEVAVLEAQMKAIHPDCAIICERRFDVPGLKPEQDGAAERLTRALTGDNASHVVSYGTEAGQFQERGFSAVVCGPGNIEQAHQPNEFISIAQLDAGEAFMNRLIDHLCKD